MKIHSDEQGKVDAPACPAGAERELCLLFVLTEALDRELDPEGLHETVLRHLASMFNADGGLLFLSNSHGEPAVASRMNMDDAEVEKEVLRRLDLDSATSEFRGLTAEDPLGKVLSEKEKGKHWRALYFNEGRGVKGLALLFRSDEAGFESFSERFTAYVIRTVSRAIEHTQLTKLVQESEQRYRRIFERLKDTLYETTKEGKFLDINQAGVDLFRFENREEVLHLNSIASLYEKPEDRSSFMKAIEEKGFVKDYETNMVTKYGDAL